MNPILELTQKRAALYDKANAILQKGTTEKRELTPEELTEVEECTVSMAALKRTIDAMQNIEAQRPDPADGGSNGRREVARAEENTEKKPFGSLGEQVLSVMRSARSGSIDPRLIEIRASLGLNESVPSDGGFLVQKDLQNTILEKMYSIGGLISRCAKFTVGANSNGIKIPGVDESSRADGSRWGGIRGYWVDEGGLKTASKPKFYMVELTLNKIAAVVYLTDELVQDAPALTTFLNRIVPQEIKFNVENAIINGDGVGKPLGILNSPATVSVAKEVGQAAGTFNFENAKKMYSRMHAPSRNNAAWFINQDVETEFWGMTQAVGTGGSAVFLPAGGATQAPHSTLFGRPIIPTEYNPALGTKGDVILADMDQYYLIEKGGVQSASSIHVQFLTDQEVLRFVYRVDGQPSWKEALSPFKGSTGRSPFVTLDTRA